MSLVDSLKDLEARGVELWLEDGRLRYRAPKDVLSPAILPQLKEKKDAICKLLRERRGPVLYPLSHSQRSLWFLHQLAPESAASNLGFAVRVRSSVDVSALQHALAELVRRHATLRTTYSKYGPDSVQEIHAYQQQLCFEQIDASQWAAAELATRVSETYKR